jgi:hypothetical protein
MPLVDAAAASGADEGKRRPRRSAFNMFGQACCAARAPQCRPWPQPGRRAPTTVPHRVDRELRTGCGDLDELGTARGDSPGSHARLYPRLERSVTGHVTATGYLLVP